MAIMSEIVDNGRVTRGYLGVQVAEQPAAGNQVGLAVQQVVPGSPAMRAGIRRGDVIVALDDMPAMSRLALTRQIASARPGTQMALDVARDGNRYRVEVTVVERPVVRTAR